MVDYRIVCTDQEPVSKPTHEAHITGVGTGDHPDIRTRRWTRGEVYAAMDEGHRFYTRGRNSNKVALVRKWACSGCKSPTLRSDPDAVLDNNLDNLPRC